MGYFSKYASNIDDISIMSNTFNLLIMEFTPTENILVMYKHRKSRIAAQLNIANMGKVFEIEKNSTS